MTGKMKPVIEAGPLQGFERKQSISGTSGGTLLDVPSPGALRNHTELGHLPERGFPQGSRDYWSCKSRDIGAATPGDRCQHLREAEPHTPPSPGCSQSSVADAQNQDRGKDLSLPAFQWCFWSHSPYALKQILSGTSG